MRVQLAGGAEHGIVDERGNAVGHAQLVDARDRLRGGLRRGVAGEPREDGERGARDERETAPRDNGAARHGHHRRRPYPPGRGACNARLGIGSERDVRAHALRPQRRRQPRLPGARRRADRPAVRQRVHQPRRARLGEPGARAVLRAPDALLAADPHGPPRLGAVGRRRARHRPRGRRRARRARRGRQRARGAAVLHGRRAAGGDLRGAPPGARQRARPLREHAVRRARRRPAVAADAAERTARFDADPRALGRGHEPRRARAERRPTTSSCGRGSPAWSGSPRARGGCAGSSPRPREIDPRPELAAITRADARRAPHGRRVHRRAPLARVRARGSRARGSSSCPAPTRCPPAATATRCWARSRSS